MEDNQEHDETTTEQEQVAEALLKDCGGGLKWQGRRQSYNVEDRRPGAPPIWRQKLNTFLANRRNGYLY